MGWGGEEKGEGGGSGGSRSICIMILVNGSGKKSRRSIKVLCGSIFASTFTKSNVLPKIGNKTPIE